ncbi:zinc-dependent alcohol dehydrogenase family protein [Streptomyces sp. 4N509B]|uniref:zinc-dependent alcohol dehydrogenase family protein n=1 Tax=Streptomyces sp. 4N509B TaxID=3457413 RepID=UPI003FD38D99
MRAVVIPQPGVVETVTVADATPGPGEVVVKVAATGVCSIDLRVLDGEYAPTLPLVPGHEFAGEVVAVGSGVTDFGIGSRVAVYPYLWCHECPACRQGRNNLCERWSAIGVTVSGGAAEYAAVPAANCVPVHDSVRLEDACLIEPLSSAIRGYDVLTSRVGVSVLIYGAGTMGLMMLELGKLSGASRVDVVDTNTERLGVASIVGCTATATRPDEFDNGRGWDVVVDCTGNDRAIEDGITRVAPGGTFLQFGVTNRAARVLIDPYRIYNKEITVTGSMVELHENFERAARLFANGVVDPKIYITHRLDLGEYAGALDMFRTGGLGYKFQIQP